MEIVSMSRDDNSKRNFLCGFPTEKKAREFVDFITNITDYTFFHAEYYGSVTEFTGAIEYYSKHTIHVTGYEFFPKKSFYKIDFINRLLKGEKIK